MSLLAPSGHAEAAWLAVTPRCRLKTEKLDPTGTSGGKVISFEVDMSTQGKAAVKELNGHAEVAV